MSRLSLGILVGSLLSALLLFAGPAEPVQAEKSAAELLPASTLAYVEITHPRDVIDLLLDHPLRKDLEQSAQYRKAIESPQFKQLQQVLKVVEIKSGVEWRTALEKMTGGGIVLAFEPITQGVVLLARADDANTASSVRETLFTLIRDDADKKGKPDPIETKHYRGLTAYHAGDAIITDLGSWMMICNKKALAQKIADTYLDGGETLSSDDQFTEARRLASGEGSPPAAWAFARLAPLRLFAGNKPWLKSDYKSDNPGIELLVGGLLPIAQNAPYVTASLWLDAQNLKLSLATPNDPAWVTAPQKFFFAGENDGAEEPLIPEGAIASVTAYRDVPAMWQSGPDLFTEAAATQMAQTDAGLSTLFGGKSFGTDILGSFQPHMQFVVAKQDYAANGGRIPGVRLPGGALVLNIKPDQFASARKHFRVGFQSLIAFSNIDGASKNRPVLEIQSEQRANCEIQYAVYSSDDAAKADASPAADKKQAGHGKEDIYLNFSPALAISKKHMILSSTRQLAEQLADLEAKEDGIPTIPQNTLVQLNPKFAAELIEQNREQLIAQNMLEKGHTREQAEKEIGVLHAIVNYFRDAKLSLTPSEKSVRLDIELKTVSPT